MTPPKERHLADREWAGGATPFLLIPCKSLQKKQAFEMKPRKNGIWLTVNRLGSPTPF
jgi:hypothetical protein